MESPWTFVAYSRKGKPKIKGETVQDIYDAPASSRTGRRSPVIMLVGMVLLCSVQWRVQAYPDPVQDVGCRTQFEAAKEVVSTEMQDFEVREFLTTYLNAAWHTFWRSKEPAQSVVVLDKLERIVESNRVKGYSPESKRIALSAIDRYRQCMARGEFPRMASVVVETFYFNETRPDGRGRSAGQEEEVYVFVDGVHLKSTDVHGRAWLEVPAGAVTVQAIVPSTSIATATVQATAGETVSLQLILDDGKEVISPAELSISPVTNGMLDPDAGDFLITLLEGGVPRPMIHVEWVELEGGFRNILARLTDEFRVDAEGRLHPVSMDAIRNAILPHAGQNLKLYAAGSDARGFTFGGYQSLYLEPKDISAVEAIPPFNLFMSAPEND